MFPYLFNALYSYKRISYCILVLFRTFWGAPIHSIYNPKDHPFNLHNQLLSIYRVPAPIAKTLLWLFTKDWSCAYRSALIILWDNGSIIGFILNLYQRTYFGFHLCSTIFEWNYYWSSCFYYSLYLLLVSHLWSLSWSISQIEWYCIDSIYVIDRNRHYTSTLMYFSSTLLILMNMYITNNWIWWIDT